MIFFSSSAFLVITSLIKFVEVSGERIILINGRGKRFEESIVSLKEYYIMGGNILYLKFQKRGYRLRKNDYSKKVLDSLVKLYPDKNLSQRTTFF